MINTDDILKSIDLRIGDLNSALELGKQHTPSALHNVEAEFDQQMSEVRARIHELELLRKDIVKSLEAEMEKLAKYLELKEVVGSRDIHKELPPLQEGQCPRYREHGLNCGQTADHAGNCEDKGPFSS